MKPVTTKWQTDGQLAVLYKVGNLLAFYTDKKDPYFKKDSMIDLDTFKKSEPYKVLEYSNELLPSDAYIDTGFAWGGE